MRMLFVSAVLVLAMPDWCSAKEISCIDGKSQHSWIQKIIIDTKTRKVVVESKPGSAGNSEHDVTKLVYGDDKSDGYPAYAFNVATSIPNQINAIKVFFVLRTWRVIDVGLREVNGTQALVGLGDNAEFICSVTGE
jgi:hypothetical protein